MHGPTWPKKLPVVVVFPFAVEGPLVDAAFQPVAQAGGLALIAIGCNHYGKSGSCPALYKRRMLAYGPPGDAMLIGHHREPFRFQGSIAPTLALSDTHHVIGPMIPYRSRRSGKASSAQGKVQECG